MVDMKSLQKYKIKLFLFCTLSFTGLICCSTTNIAQNNDGGSVTEVVGEVRLSNSLPAANTVVRLIPASYNPIIDARFRDLLIDTTNSIGSYFFGNVDPGTYCLEGYNLVNFQRVMLRNISINGDREEAFAIAPVALKDPGAIIIPFSQGDYSLDGYFYIPGSTWLLTLNNSNLTSNQIVLDSVPAGTIPSIQYAVYGAPVSTSIGGATMVPEGDTTVLAIDLPVPWQGAEIGGWGVSGSAGFANGTFTIAGGGPDIWDTADGFYFVYRQLDGDGEIVARVESYDTAITYAKAGIMIRETLGPSSRNVSLFIEKAIKRELPPDTFFSYATNLTSRNTIAGSTHKIEAKDSCIAPYWIKLTRTGDVINGFISPDGITWNSLSGDTLPIQRSVFIGMAVSSFDYNRITQVFECKKLHIARFDNVAVTIKY